MDNCVSPPALDEQHLLAYLDGEADQSVAAHLEKCPSCRDRAGEIARLQNKLNARLYRLSCPPPDELGEYHLGLLPAGQRMAVAQHLVECPHCKRELAQLKSYLSELAPPPRAGVVEGIRILVARLTGEGGRAYGSTALEPAYAGLRGGVQGPVTLEADGILIILDIQPASEGRAVINGQVAADEQDAWTCARVELRQGGVQFRTTAIDELGSFRYDDVSPGPAEIQIIPGSGMVVLATVEIAV